MLSYNTHIDTIYNEFNDTGGLTCASLVPHFSQDVVSQTWDEFPPLRRHSGLPRYRELSWMWLLSKTPRIITTVTFPGMHLTATWKIKSGGGFKIWEPGVVALTEFCVVGASVVVGMLVVTVVGLLVAVEVEDVVVLCWTWVVLTVTLIGFPDMEVEDVVVPVESTPG